MMHTINEADKKVAELLKEWDIDSWAISVATDCRDNDGWEHDSFSVSFQKYKQSPVSFDFKTGSGNRFNDFKQNLASPAVVRNYNKEIKNLYPETKQTTPTCVVIKNIMEKESYYSRYSKLCNAYVFIPTQANVLYCLLSDLDALEYTFEDWCANFGYDTDSRKAEKIFQDCMENGKKLLKIFSKEQIEVLREVLQDY